MLTAASSAPQDLPALFLSGSTSALLDLSGLDLPPPGTTQPATPTRPGNQSSPEQLSASVSLLDDELMSLGKEEDSAGQPAGTSVLLAHSNGPVLLWEASGGHGEQHGFPILGEALARRD